MEQAKKFVDPVQPELPAPETQFTEQLTQTEKLQKTWGEWQNELNSVQEKQKTLTEQRHLQQQRDEKLRTQAEEKDCPGSLQSLIYSIIQISSKK